MLVLVGKCGFPGIFYHLKRDFNLHLIRLGKNEFFDQ